MVYTYKYVRVYVIQLSKAEQGYARLSRAKQSEANLNVTKLSTHTDHVTFIRASFGRSGGVFVGNRKLHQS